MTRAPPFWYARPGPVASLLAPLGLAYAAAGRLRRAVTQPQRVPVPVICVGNATVGGAGKTPVALDIAVRLQAMGVRVHLISRGYGGKRTGAPVRVAADQHSAAEVGDEALLLARAAPTWVGGDRVAAARAATAAGAEALVLDDGFQNPRLAKDLSLLVIDGGGGVGNGRVLPAGPLREPLARALARADAVVRLGHAPPACPIPLPSTAERPLLTARLVPTAEARTLAGRRVLAFAGIGRPGKLAETLHDLGVEVVAFAAFPDHHPYRQGEVTALRTRATAEGLTLVTTEKDLVRLPPAARAGIYALPVQVAWDDPDALDALLRRTVTGGGT